MATGVRFEGVSKRFGEVEALAGVTLSVAPGELFFLLGPSGCGKTTLLRCLAGFYKPDGGRILLGDKDITHLDAHRRETAMVFQSYALWPHMSVAGNVAFGLRQRGGAREEIRGRVREALASVRMEALGERKPNQLSGGQQQRVALARALVVRPRCLLLDEPLSNLDAQLRAEMREEIRRVCKEFGLTAIYVTHDQAEALSVADRIAVMDAGRVAQAGTPLELYRRPRTRFVAAFIGRSNFIDGVLTGVEPGGAARVRTNLGELRGILADEAAPPREGAEVLVSIRPEAVRLGGDECVMANVFEGEIGRSVYYGEVAHHELVVTVPAAAAAAAAHGACSERIETHTLRVSELNPREASGARGTLRAQVPPEDVVVMRV